MASESVRPCSLGSVPVVFSADRQYCVPTYIAIRSMLVNHKDERILEVFVMVPGDFPDRCKELFRRLEGEFDRWRLRFATSEARL